MLNVAVIGLGRMGKLHMNNCFYIDGIRVVAAADQSKNSLARAKSIGIPRLYTSYADLLDDRTLNLDAAIICLPNFLHVDSISHALEVGLNVFVEKPMANSSEECRKIVSLVKKSGRKLMIGHSSRFVDAVEKMKVSADRGHIGSLEALTMEEVINGPFEHRSVPTPVPEWWFDPSKVGGGALMDLGYHLIDLFRFFTTKNCKVLFSCINHKFNLPVEDGAIVILQSDDSMTKGIVNVGWYQKSIFPQFNFRLIIHGSAGYMSSDKLVPKNMYIYAIKEGTKNLFRKAIRKKIRPLSYTYFATAYYKELEHFFDCVIRDQDPSVSSEDGLRTIETIEEAYKISIESARRSN
jgi:myo-inositol 2-dehydrogenase/D-chiro-inositol 1-dehydrogenase